MYRRSKILLRIFRAWPGKRLFGVYRFLPVFFLSGAFLEYLMIHWKAGPNETNFYTTYKKNLATREAAAILQRELLIAEEEAYRAEEEAYYRAEEEAHRAENSLK